MTHRDHYRQAKVFHVINKTSVMHNSGREAEKNILSLLFKMTLMRGKTKIVFINVDNKQDRIFFFFYC